MLYKVVLVSAVQQHESAITKWAFLKAQRVKNLPAKQETRVWSLGREDPLEKEMAMHSRILAWRLPWTESLVGYSTWGRKSKTQLIN